MHFFEVPRKVKLTYSRGVSEEAGGVSVQLAWESETVPEMGGGNDCTATPGADATKLC